MIKKFLAFALLTIVFCCVLSSTCLAHSGMTDSHGGHYVGGTSNYHYHCGGHPAHQHENGVCPYDKKESSYDWLTIFAAIVVIGPIVLIVVSSFITFLIGIFSSKLKKNNKIKANKNYISTKTIEELESEIEELNNEKADIIWALRAKANNNCPQAEIDALTYEKERLITRIEALEKEKSFKQKSFFQ